jgi:hypothetical protein
MRRKLVSAVLALCALLAAALVVPGGVALAGTTRTPITQDDLDKTNRYEINANGTYYLDSTGTQMTGSILISSYCSQVTLDLNGKKLTSSDTNPALFICGKSVTVNNGSLYSKSGISAISVASLSGGNIQLKNVRASSVGSTCLDLGEGSVTCHNCTFTATNNTIQDIGAVMIHYGTGAWTGFYAMDGTSLELNGQGYVIMQTQGTSTSNDHVPSLSVKTTLSSFPVMKFDDETYHITAELADQDNCVLQYTNNQYRVINKADVSDDVRYRVEDVEGFGTVYFDNLDEANLVANALGKSVVSKCSITYTTKRGTAPDTQYVWPGDTTTEPDALAKSGAYSFVEWRKDGVKFDFATAITADITLVAKWTPEPAVAEIVRDGESIEQYASISDALEEVQAGDTVKLLMDTAEQVTIGKDMDLTLDLNQKTLSVPDDLKDEDAGAINVEDNAKLVITNGTVKGADGGKAACVYLGSDTTADVTFSNVTMSGRYAPLHADSGKLTFAGSDNSLSASFRVDYAMYLEGTAEVVIEGGNFEAGGYSKTDESDDMGCISLAGEATLNIKGGTFDDRIYVKDTSAELTISGGSFARPHNAASVVSGKVFYMPKSSRYYNVVDTKTAREDARWVVTPDEDAPAVKVYTYSKSAAAEYFDTLSDGSMLHKMHKVTIKEDGKVLSTSYLESEVDKYGELPEAKQVDGYKFIGWYVDDDEVTSTDAPTDELDYEVEVLAMWVKEDKPVPTPDADPEPTPTPSGDSEDSGSKTVLPDTGDSAGIVSCLAAAGAVLSFIGGARRRK